MNLYLYILVMALVTYLIRMIPFTLLRKKISSPFLRSFLGYVPYAVLAAMTIPGILFSTGSVLSAAVGTIVAVALAFFGQGLLTVAVAACFTAWLAEFICGFLLK